LPDFKGWTSKGWTVSDIHVVVRTSISKDGPRFEVWRDPNQGGALWLRATRKHSIAGLALGEQPQAQPQEVEAAGRFRTKNRGRELQWQCKQQPSETSCSIGANPHIPEAKNRYDPLDEATGAGALGAGRPLAAEASQVLPEALAGLLVGMCADGPVSVADIEKRYVEWTEETLEKALSPHRMSVLTALRNLPGCEVVPGGGLKPSYFLRKRPSATGSAPTEGREAKQRPAPAMPRPQGGVWRGAGHRVAVDGGIPTSAEVGASQRCVPPVPPLFVNKVVCDYDATETGYLSLRRGAMLMDTGKITDGWAFGKFCDRKGNVTSSGWYPPAYAVHAGSLKVVSADWTPPTEFGNEYLTVEEGDELCDTGRGIEDGWAWGELCDGSERKGWYPPSYATTKEFKPCPDEQQSQLGQPSNVSEVEEDAGSEAGSIVSPDVPVPQSVPVQSKPVNQSKVTTKKMKASQRRAERRRRNAEAATEAAAAAPHVAAAAHVAASPAEAAAACAENERLQAEVARLRKQLELSTRPLKVPEQPSAAPVLSNDGNDDDTDEADEEEDKADEPETDAAQKRITHLEAVLKRQVNGPAAERGGYAGLSPEAAARHQSRLAAEVERGRLHEAQARSGGDGGPADVFALRAKSAKAESLRGYRQRIESGSTPLRAEDVLARVSGSEGASGKENKKEKKAEDRAERNKGPGGKPKTGDWVEVVKVLGKDTSGVIGRRGEVIGTCDLQMNQGKTSCTVRFRGKEKGRPDEEKTFDAADLKVVPKAF